MWLWSIGWTMPGILWADRLGRGQPDKVLLFLTRIYLAATDKQDSGTMRPTDTGPRQRKIPVLSVGRVKTRRARWSKHARYEGPLWAVAERITQERPLSYTVFRNMALLSTSFWFMNPEPDPRPATSEPLNPLATLSTLAELLWDKQGNSRSVKDKRLFD